MRKIKIGIIGTNGLPGRYGGWDHLLNELTKALGQKHDIVVYTSYKNGFDHLTHYNDAELRRIRLDANGWQSIPYDVYSMYLSVVNRHDVLLVLGTSGCIVMPILSLLKARVILNPDGVEWERGKWGWFAKAILYAFDKIGILFSTYVVADNAVIARRVEEKRKKNVYLIEYGGDNAKKVPFSSDFGQRYKIESGSYAFKVCRIVPENNIEKILDSFLRTGLLLVLVGNWEVSDYSRVIYEKYNGFDNLRLIGPIYEQEKIDSLRSNCRIYVHGHSVGGTNPSLVEAMSLDLPCFVCNVNYNVETTEGAAIYFGDGDDLSNMLIKYWDDILFLKEVGGRLGEVARRRYTWGRIVDQYDQLFNSIMAVPKD